MLSTEVGTKNTEMNQIKQDSCPSGVDILTGKLDIKQVMTVMREGLGDTKAFRVCSTSRRKGKGQSRAVTSFWLKLP